jgi:hypothetical protein
MADTKFATFLKSKKLDARRILAVSHKLETFRPEDRAIKLAKRTARSGAEGEADKKKDLGKPRSGRPITQRAIDAALKGGTVSGPTKQRILRAVNYLLAQKKQDKVELKTLF